MTPSVQEVKSCCASAYSSAAARWLLGDSFHPGGPRLTARLIEALAVERAATVVDVACGPGWSALQLVRATGCSVVGVDLSPESVVAAERRVRAAGLAARARFLVGDAEALPIDDAIADGVLCECALCTFPDKAAAATEIARVLKPGGRLALSDVVGRRERLPAELRSLEAWVACLGDVRSPAELESLLEHAGLSIENVEREDAALVELSMRVEARLRLAQGFVGDAVEQGLAMARAARAAVAEGALGYAVVIARR
jgi:ubiquinone/menaquinone biosynthesis C-methylase UbiE